MKIFPKRKTDDEYIEQLRISYKRRWFIFAPVLLISVLMIATLFYTFHELDKKGSALFASMLANVNPTENDRNNNLIALSHNAGILKGFLLGSGLIARLLVIIQTIGFVIDRRKDVMLLKYYDKNKNPNKPPLGNPAPPSS